MHHDLAWHGDAGFQSPPENGHCDIDTDGDGDDKGDGEGDSSTSRASTNIMHPSSLECDLHHATTVSAHPSDFMPCIMHHDAAWHGDAASQAPPENGHRDDDGDGDGDADGDGERGGTYIEEGDGENDGDGDGTLDGEGHMGDEDDGVTSGDGDAEGLSVTNTHPSS